jgi:putative transposase
MARGIRIEYPGAFYHVMARGNRRERIFREDADRVHARQVNTLLPHK